MTHALLIDWLSITVKQWPGGWPFFDLDSAELINPRYGYKSAFKDSNGVVAYNGGNADSLHIVYSGAALNTIRENGVTTREMIDTLTDAGARITRLDLACDWLTPGETVAELHKQIEDGLADIQVRKWSYLSSENNGQTLYIGSRSSARMVRIYNKRAELAGKSIQVDHEWIRIEVELKDDQAQNAAHALRDNELGAVLAAHLARVIDFPSALSWCLLMMELPNPAPITPSVQGRTNTDEWLLGVVAPILRRRLTDPEFERLWSVAIVG